MSVAIITGSCGLVGSAAVAHFAAQGMHVVGIDNDMRAEFFGPAASTNWMRDKFSGWQNYEHHSIDLRDHAAIHRIFRKFGSNISLVIHAAAQPSHDWSAQNPDVDFAINATGTLNVLEAMRTWSSDAAFIFLSTNKVYGDWVNTLPFVEESTRWELVPNHKYERGIDEHMPIDQTMHSLFGASKLAADILVQEYGRYYEMTTAVFRCGCLSGPNHSGAEQHGFLSYLLRCAVERKPYTICGYKGKQVRDNLHSDDLVRAFQQFIDDPDRGGVVYNLGGGRRSNCSVIEAIAAIRALMDTAEMETGYYPRPRRGDHIWWITDNNKFCTRYPEWQPVRTTEMILADIYVSNEARWCKT